MVDFEKRSSKRTLVPAIPTTLILDDGSTCSGYLIDLSETGAFLQGCLLGQGGAIVRFEPFRRVTVERPCAPTRCGVQDSKWVAVKFASPLSTSEIRRLTIPWRSGEHAGTRDTYHFASLDYAEVSHEIRTIRTCRSNIFAWTMGFISSATLTIWTLAIDHKVTYDAVLPAMAVIACVFFLGLASNTEKARAMNMREGFLSAMGVFLAKGEGPAGYLGWSCLKHHLSECGARRRTAVCPRRIPSTGDISCRDEGEVRAGSINAAKRAIPALMDSFASLTSAAYTVVFVVLLLLFGYSLTMSWSETYSLPHILTLSAFTAGLILSPIIARYHNIVIGVIVGVLFTILLGSVFSVNTLNALAALGMGLLGGCIAWFMIRQLYSVRMGSHSYESYMYSWLCVLEHCIISPDDVLTRRAHEAPPTWREWANVAVRWLVGLQSHEEKARYCESVIDSTRVRN